MPTTTTVGTCCCTPPCTNCYCYPSPTNVVVTIDTACCGGVVGTVFYFAFDTTSGGNCNEWRWTYTGYMGDGCPPLGATFSCAANGLCSGFQFFALWGATEIVAMTGSSCTCSPFEIELTGTYSNNDGTGCCDGPPLPGCAATGTAVAYTPFRMMSDTSPGPTPEGLQSDGKSKTDAKPCGCDKKVKKPQTIPGDRQK